MLQSYKRCNSFCNAQSPIDIELLQCYSFLGISYIYIREYIPTYLKNKKNICPYIYIFICNIVTI
jgi:hypothetical protein